MSRFCYSLFFAFAACFAFAQAKVPEAKDPPVVDPGFPLHSPQELWLTGGFLLFGLAVLLIIRFSLPKDTSQVDISRIYGGPIIVICALLLITTGISEKATAPAFGLFGTIAGYILGRASAESKKQDQ